MIVFLLHAVSRQALRFFSLGFSDRSRQQSLSSL